MSADTYQQTKELSVSSKWMVMTAWLGGSEEQESSPNLPAVTGVKLVSVRRSRETRTETRDDPNPLSLLGQALLDGIRQAVRAELEVAHLHNGHENGDRLLDAKQAAELLAVSPDWLYRRADRLAFTRKLAPRVVRFSYQGIQKYLASRKPS